jgi:RNA polymerase sigma-70 factor (ECF subfamily)
MNNRPKRRKSSDNPYTLQIINNTYVVIFKDSSNKNQIIEVSKEVFNEMNQFELDDLKELNEFDRHTEHSELLDNTIYKRAVIKNDEPMDIIERQIITEDLKSEIAKLPEIQKRRIIKYFFYSKTYEEIAKEEKCSKVAIKYSIDNAIEKISKKFKN